ncbi:MAG: ArnT family glycosyltransferase [Flavobacteriales bacterium]
MNNRWKNKSTVTSIIFLFILCIAFIILKIPYLNLPFYWDESWVYGPAVRLMSENGPSLLPDAVPVEYGRGHPLLFHFLGGCWVSVFGSSLFSMHCFALTISMTLVISIFFIVKKLFNPVAAYCCSILICLQPIFFAQSVMVLPEVLLAVFICCGIYHYIRKNYSWYFVFASCAVLVKETAVLLPLSVLVFQTIVHFKKGISFKPYIKYMFIWAAPVLFFALTLLLNYWYYGWFVFPDHKESITTDASLIWKNLTKGYGAFLFIYQARNVLSAVLLIILIYFLSKKEKISFTQPVVFIIFFTALFIIFSSFNFYSNRYMFLIIILFLILVSVALSSSKLPRVFPVLAILAVGFFSIREMQKDNHNDYYPGYCDHALAQQKMISWCVQHNLQHEKIISNFLAMHALINPKAGYVTNKTSFKNVSVVPYDDYNYLFVGSNETIYGLKDVIERGDFILIHTVQIHDAKCQLYKRRFSN